MGWNLLVTWDYVLACICLVGVLMFGTYKYTSIPPIPEFSFPFLFTQQLVSSLVLFPVLFPPCRSFWDLVSRLVFFLPVSLDYYLAEFNIHSCHEFLVCSGVVQTILPCLPWPLCPSALCCRCCRSRLITPSCACPVLVMSRRALPLGLGCVRNKNLFHIRLLKWPLQPLSQQGFLCLLS